jgi:hypothetical protein
MRFPEGQLSLSPLPIVQASPGTMFYSPLSGFTLLHKAAQRGDEDEVLRLLEVVRLVMVPTSALPILSGPCNPREQGCCVCAWYCSWQKQQLL